MPFDAAKLLLFFEICKKKVYFAYILLSISFALRSHYGRYRQVCGNYKKGTGCMKRDQAIQKRHKLYKKDTSCIKKTQAV